MDNPRQVAAENRNLRRKPKPPPNTSYTTTKPAIQNPIIFFSLLSLNFPSTQTKGKKKNPVPQSQELKLNRARIRRCTKTLGFEKRNEKSEQTNERTQNSKVRGDQHSLDIEGDLD